MNTGGLLTTVTLHPVKVNVNVIAAKNNNARFIYLSPYKCVGLLALCIIYTPASLYSNPLSSMSIIPS